MRVSIVLLALQLIPLVTLAQPRPATPAAADAPARPDARYALTIYSTADPATFDPQNIAQERQFDPQYRIPGFGVVRELRRVPLVAGENLLKFTDVAAGIDPTTVSFKSLTAPDSTSVLEQNFEYDLLNPDKLLGKYVGRSIIVNRKQEPVAGERTRMPETIEARLLSFTADQLVLQTNNKQLPVQIIPRSTDITEIKLFDLQTGLITKPTLVWRLNAEKAGDHDVLVSYQTDNVTWRADYTVVVNKDDTAADLSSWVTIVNESGASYPDAKLKLVAGDVRRLRDLAGQRVGYNARGGLFGGGAVDTGFQERSLFEYHLYTLGRPASIANQSTKQIELFPLKPNLPLTKTYVYDGFTAEPFARFPQTDRDLRGRANKKVDVYLGLKNAEKVGLGIPLPAGRVRVYKRDDGGGGDAAAIADPFAASLEFVGEDKIDHTPKDEQLLIRVGSAFDVVGDRKQTDFTQDGHTITETFEVKLRNHKKQPLTVLVQENLLRSSQWEITASTVKFTKHDASTIHFDVEVPGDQEKVITYTVKYTW